MVYTYIGSSDLRVRQPNCADFAEIRNLPHPPTPPYPVLSEETPPPPSGGCTHRPAWPRWFFFPYLESIPHIPPRLHGLSSGEWPNGGSRPMYLVRLSRHWYKEPPGAWLGIRPPVTVTPPYSSGFVSSFCFVLETFKKLETPVWLTRRWSVIVDGDMLLKILAQ